MTTASPIIASAEAESLESLLPMIREFHASEGLPWDEDAIRSCLAWIWEDPRYGRVWIVRVDDEPVGYGVLCFGFSLEHGGVDAFVDELYVRPAGRGRGIGTAILNAMESACREAGVTALHLEVDHVNTDGQRLYRRHGFVDHDRHLMTKRLA